MKNILSAVLLSVIFFTTSNQILAQERPDRLYSVSGVGFSIPVGETADYFKPKFSTSIGLNIGLGKGPLFLYPKVSLHAYGYSERSPENGYTYTLKEGRATTYLMNLALGYRKISGKFAHYAFVGGGGGIILTPQISVNNATLQAELNNKSNGMGMIEGGIGLEYNVGQVNLFVESSYQYGFSKIQQRTFNAVPITIGIKPNLGRLLKRKD